jgi:hypothetical protein
MLQILAKESLEIAIPQMTITPTEKTKTGGQIVGEATPKRRGRPKKVKAENEFVGPINAPNRKGVYASVALDGDAKNNNKAPLAPKPPKAVKEKAPKATSPEPSTLDTTAPSKKYSTASKGAKKDPTKATPFKAPDSALSYKAAVESAVQQVADIGSFRGPIQPPNRKGVYASVALDGDAKNNNKAPLAPKAPKAEKPPKAVKEKAPKTKAAKATKAASEAKAVEIKNPPSSIPLVTPKAKASFGDQAESGGIKGLLPPDRKFDATQYGKHGPVIPRSARQAAKAEKAKATSQAKVSPPPIEVKNPSSSIPTVTPKAKASFADQVENSGVKGLLPPARSTAIPLVTPKLKPSFSDQGAGNGIKGLLPPSSDMPKPRRKAMLSQAKGGGESPAALRRIPTTGKEMGLSFQVMHPRWAKGTPEKGGKFMPKNSLQTVAAQLKALHQAHASGKMGTEEFQRLGKEIAGNAAGLLAKVNTPQAQAVAERAKQIAGQGAGQLAKGASSLAKAAGSGIAHVADIATRPAAIQAYKNIGTAMGDAAIEGTRRALATEKGQKLVKGIRSDIKAGRKKLKVAKSKIANAAVTVARGTEAVTNSKMGKGVKRGVAAARKAYDAVTSPEAKQAYETVGKGAVGLGQAVIELGRKTHQAMNSERGQQIDRAIKSGLSSAAKGGASAARSLGSAAVKGLGSLMTLGKKRK